MKLDEVLNSIINDALATRSSKGSDWANSKWGKIRDLGPDEKGSIGEELCAEALRQSGFKVEYDPNKTSDDKDYDMLVEGKRVEVKFATRGATQKTFQHENLDKTRHWDILVIIDISPNKIYAKCTTKDDLPWKDSMHRRKDSTFYKYTLSVSQHEKEGNEVKTIEDIAGKFREALSSINN